MNQIDTQTRPKRNLRQKLSEWYISFVITFLSISFWSVFVLYFRPLYYWSISLFHIEKNSGLITILQQPFQNSGRTRGTTRM